MMKNVFSLEEIKKSQKINLIDGTYTHIRAYHACRPISIDDYLLNGIRPISYESALHEVKSRVICEWVSENTAVEKFNEEWNDFDDIHKKVWLEMNKNLLLDGASHYLIYGSEFINALAMQLGCRSRLKKIGVPTIFHCDIPIEDIPEKTLKDIQYSFNKGYTDAYGFSVQMLDANNIVDYEHPKQRIPDPYGGSYRPNYAELRDLGFVTPKSVKM